MTKKEFVEFSGAPGSPYTRKMLALLRYRRIPYRNCPSNKLTVENTENRYPTRPSPKVSLLPTFYFESEDGEPYAACDSTPIIRRFEEEYKGREVIPPGELGFLNYLIEDYGDEWLTKAMFHYRWSYESDISKAGQMLPRWNNTSADEASLQQKAKDISALQISRLSYVGSNSITKDTIEGSFERLIDILNKLLTQQPFILGKRPSSCDFAIYGQLTCLALFDPTPQKLILERAPRLYAWTESLEDLSGFELLPGDWNPINSQPEALGELLDEIGRVYVPYLLANADAAHNERSEFECEIDGRRWSQNTFIYQAKCLQWIRNEFENLTPEAEAAVNDLLDRSQCARLLE